MTTDTDPITARRALPARPAPALELALVGGGTYRLSEQRPARFTMLVFNRGLHCPLCRAQLRELDRRRDELQERGVEVVSVSGDTEARATRMRDDWGVRRVPIAYGLTEASMREWGLLSLAASPRASRPCSTSRRCS